MKKAVNSEKVHDPFGPYSVAIEKNGTLYLSGQGPFDQNKQLIGEEIEEQTRQTLNNVKNILDDNGYGMEDVLKVTVYLADISLWDRFNQVYASYFPLPQPARTVVACQLNGMLVEIDGIAQK